MLRPSARFPLFAAAGVVASLSTGACTSSSSNPSLDPPHLTITSVDNRGVPSTESDGGQSCAQIVTVNVGPNDGTGHLVSPATPPNLPVSWTISPPQTCVGTPPCGYLQLRVYPCLSADASTCSSTPVQIIDSGGPSISLTIATTTGDASVGFDRFYRFQVQLFNPDTSPAVDVNGKSYSKDVVQEVNAACAVAPPPPQSDGGRDASADASAPPKEAGPLRPPDAAIPPPPDATTPMDATLPRRDASPPDAPPPPDAAHPPDATLPVPDAHTP
ncbi:MAG TPA: hypothetical protein VHC69_28735 [Polyangiaceae bacterium]|nr:hypothetical protein [Polyangiaceae bacterium]